MNESTSPSYPHSLRRVPKALAAVALGAALQLVPAFVSAQAAPNHTVSPLSMTFSAQVIGTVSPPQTATINYTGFSTMTIGPITAIGPFQFLSTCSSISYAGPTSCSVDVKFAPPLVVGPFTGTLTVTTSDGSPDIISLSGDAVAVPVAVAGLAPSSLDFGTQSLGTLSAPQTVVLTNIGTDYFYVQSINSDNVLEFPVTYDLFGGGLASPPPDQPKGSPERSGYDGDYRAATGQGRLDAALNPKNAKISAAFTCGLGAYLYPGDACTFDVVFSPITSGAKSSVISVSTSTLSGSPAAGVTSLLATGIGASGRTIALSPSSIDFGDVILNQTSTPKTFSIRSTGFNTVTISDLSVGPTTGKSAIARKVLTDFTLQHDCTTLAPLANCTGNVSFKPSAIGARHASVIVTGDFEGSPLNIPLAGTGLPVPVPGLTLSVSSIGFGQRGYGDQSSTQEITLTSSGLLPVTIASIYTLGDFFRTSTCPTVLNPGQSCTVTIGFNPSLFGVRNGELVVVSDAPDSPQSVQLQGTGCTPMYGASFLTLRGGIPVCPH